jgi:hypothetical protein
MNPNWLFRMSRWARNPPSAAKVKFVAGIITVALIVVGLEALGWWPESLTAEKMRP